MMEIANIVNEYLRIYPGEKELLSILITQTSSTSDEQLINRKNYEGHCTASTYVVCKTTKRVLLMDHKFLGLKLQPGGHIDQDDTSTLDAAYRELVEETGIRRDQASYRPLIPGLPLIPFDIYTQPIPENTKKNELKHFHHDFGYLFIVDDESDIQINADESDGFEWVSWETFISFQTFKKIAKKIEQLLTTRSESHFFASIYQNIGAKIPANTRFIVVQHILPNSYEFLRFLHHVSKGELTVFAKPKSIHSKTRSKLESIGVEIREAKRKNDISYFLGDSSKKAILLDIGGYFAEIATIKDLPIIAIIEDTENGHKKYLEMGDKINYPVFSVARSPLKINEDRLVGESIVHSAENILRSQNILLEYYQCAIIGYGKIGEGISGRLLKSNIKPLVTEIDPQRLLRAVNNYCYASSLENSLAKSRVIFCASGSQAIGINEFRLIRNGAYLISVTSSEDEFDLSQFNNEYISENIAPYIKKYVSENNYFYLVNDGNAINFVRNGALGPYIFVVMGEILSLALSALQEKSNTTEIYTSTHQERGEIARLWLNEFVTI